MVHCLVTGGRLSHAMASFIPLVSGPHAVFCADRAASASVSCDAEAQLRPPLYSTHTLQVDFCADSVD